MKIEKNKLTIPTIETVSKAFTDNGIKVISITEKRPLTFDCLLESETEFYDLNYEGENYLSNADQLLNARKALELEHNTIDLWCASGMKRANGVQTIDPIIGFETCFAYYLETLRRSESPVEVSE